MKITDLPFRATVIPNTPHWFLIMPVISSCHITKEDCDILIATGHQLDFGIATLTDIAGDPAREKLTESTKKLLLYLHEQGYFYVSFDSDGIVYDDLPKFSW